MNLPGGAPSRASWMRNWMANPAAPEEANGGFASHQNPRSRSERCSPTMALPAMIRNRDGGRSGRCHIDSGVAEGRSIAEVGKGRSRDRVGGRATLDLAPVTDGDDDDASRHQVAGTDPRHTGDLPASVVDANGLALVDPTRL